MRPSAVVAEPNRTPDPPTLVPSAPGDLLPALYEEHAAALTRRLRWLTGDAQLAADLCQETFVEVLARLGTVTAADEPAAWLHSVAINRWRNHRAKARRRLRLDANLAPTSERLGEGADASAREHEMLARLDLALSRLDVERREAFVLRVMEQLPLEQVATILGVPMSTISHRAAKAEAAVRAALEQER